MIKINPPEIPYTNTKKINNGFKNTSVMKRVLLKVLIIYKALQLSNNKMHFKLKNIIGATFLLLASIPLIAQTPTLKYNGGDPSSWSNVTTGITATMSISQMTFDGNQFVILPSNGTDISITSPDGINWTSHPGTVDPWVRGIAYGNGLYVAINYIDDIKYSTDAITWTDAIYSPTAGVSWNDITFGNGTFVAVGTAGTPANSPKKIAYSNDGITWTAINATSNTKWRGVTHGNGRFVAVGDGINGAMYSDDGITWTQAATIPGVSEEWTSVTYGNGKYVSVSFDSGKTMSSPDGNNWTISPATDNSRWQSVAYGGGKFAAIGSHLWNSSCHVFCRWC